MIKQNNHNNYNNNNNYNHNHNHNHNNDDFIRDSYRKNSIQTHNLENDNKMFQKMNKLDLINSESLIHDNHGDLIKNLTEEIFEKDKIIQELKNDVELIKKDFTSLSQKKDQFKSNVNEINMLKGKMIENYKIIKNLEEKNIRLEELESNIKKTNIIVLKQKCEIIKITKERNHFYKNDKLKNILLKNDFTDEKIKLKFNELKISHDTIITKELIGKIINKS